MTIAPWRVITVEQLKQGWMELRGVTPIHHEYQVLRRFDDGTYAVRNPELFLLETEPTQDENDEKTNTNAVTRSAETDVIREVPLPHRED